MRFVRDPQTGTARVDPDGRASGRGAYLHRSAECVELARRRGALARALRAEIEARLWETLL